MRIGPRPVTKRSARFVRVRRSGNGRIRSRGPALRALLESFLTRYRASDGDWIDVPLNNWSIDKAEEDLGPG